MWKDCSVVLCWQSQGEALAATAGRPWLQQLGGPFVRAIRKKWRPWLQQLGGKMREAVRADGMPETIYKKNGQPVNGSGVERTYQHLLSKRPRPMRERESGREREGERGIVRERHRASIRQNTPCPHTWSPSRGETYYLFEILWRAILLDSESYILHRYPCKQEKAC